MFTKVLVLITDVKTSNWLEIAVEFPLNIVPKWFSKFSDHHKNSITIWKQFFDNCILNS